MRRASVLRLVVCVGLLLGLGAVTAGQGASAAGPRSATSSMWTPMPAPLPSSLPSGQPPASATLYGTSCASASFCVAVGRVIDTADTTFPLLETYSGGGWTASIAPVPANVVTPGGDEGVLYGVGCSVEGTCAAVGDYNTTDGDQEPLLETFSGGTWTASEGTQPEAGLPNMFGVSCPDATCMAVGSQSNWGSNTWSGLIYVLDGGTWQLQSQPPLPSDYGDNLVLQSVSCPDASDCVVAGSYGPSSHGLILTETSGTWSDEETPLPANADPDPPDTALQVLYAIDCADVGDCVAGGGYVDTSGNIDPLLVTLQSGTWTATEAPVPPDSQADTLSLITGMSCPTVGACVADGYYWVNYNGGDESGMVLTQSGSGWTATSSGIPATPYAKALMKTRKAPVSGSLYGISCPKKNVCRAVGQSGTHPLVEKMKKKRR